MLKYIIFDFDGTIADSMNMMLELGNELADKYGLNRITRNELLSLNHLPIKERCKRLGIPLIKVPQYFIELVNKSRDGAPSLKLFEGIDNLVFQLSQSYKLVIISSNSIELIKSFLNYNNLHCISQVESSNGLFGKDNAIKKFLKNNKVNKEDVIYIGDELRDIVASKKAGVKIISVSWGYDSYDLLTNGNPDFLVNKPEEILAIIDSFIQ